MDAIKRKIDIDLYSPTSYEVLKAQQGDNLSRIIEFVLYDQGEPYQIPSDVFIRMEGSRGDNSTFIKDNCTISNNVISTVLDNDILFAHGTVEAKIVLYNISDDTILSTIPFKIHVQKHPCDKTKIEKDKHSLIDYLILSFEKIKGLFENHMSDKILHLSKVEHDRFNKLKNEIFIAYNENTPDYLEVGDYYLKEYK